VFVLSSQTCEYPVCNKACVSCIAEVEVSAILGGSCEKETKIL
jgi:hypothetical protein